MKKKYPLIGSTINNRDAKIVVKVKELKQGSRIDDQTSLLSINDGTREYSSLNHLSYFSKQNYFDIGYNNYLINSLSSTDQFFGLLQYGIIKLNISVSDYAGNYLSENYDIAYLPNVPSGPSSFLVLNANDYGYSYFIEGIPNVVEVVFDSPIYNFGATCLGQELEYETLDNKRFIVSTTALPQLVQRSSAVFERTYSESDNLRGKIVHFEYDASDVGASDFNFQPLKYYKILIDDVYLMKTRADINGKIRFDYKILGKEVYNIKIQEVDEQVYPIKFTGKNRDNNEDPAGFWTYTLVVDSVSPSIIVDELIKTKSDEDENILIRAKVENENFDLIAKINISNYSNNNDEVPAQQFYMDQLSNDEFAYKLFIPEGVKHGDKINYVVIIEDRAGKIGHSENGIIEIDNSRPGVIVENIETGPGKYIKKTVYDKDEFYVKDYDNKINITGVINGTAPVHVWHGATKIDLVLNDKKEFMLPLNLTSFPNTLYPNNLIFVIGGKDPYEVVLYSDNEFPNVPSISFEDSIGGIVDSTMPVALVEYDEMVNLIDYRVMNASNNVVINKDQISFETEDNKEFLLKINKPMADGDYSFEIKAKDELGNEQLFYSNQVFRVNAGETQIYLIYPKHGAVTTPSFLLKIGTTRYEKCRYTSINPIDQTGLYNYNNEKLMYSFTPQDLKLKPLEHEGQYSIVTSNPNNPLYVVCTDGVETIHKLFTNLRYDNVKPEITSATLSRPIIDYRPTETEFIIKTNEKTICKYASNQEYESFDEGKEYDSMHWFDHESVETESSYKVEHRQLIRVSQEEKEYIYHVICEDLAGLKSEVADIEFEVKNQVLSIEVIEPPKVTSDVKFNFKIKTSQIAECYYKNHKDQNSLLNLMELNYEDMTHTEYFSEYSYWEEPFASGQHSYYFQCIQAAASSLTGYRKVVELVYNFTVDTTPPLLTKFNIPQDYFCALSDGKYSLTFSLEGMDPESSVDGFNYTLVDSNYNPVIDEKYALVSQKTIILSGLTLDKSLGYKLGAKAVNPASMLASSQAFNYSTLMFVYGADSTKCLNDQTGPKITVKKTATGQGIRVDLECEDENGCSSKNYNYDVAASKEECTPTIPYDFVEGVLITENSYICWSVKDNLDNPSEGSWLIEIKDTDKDGVPDELDIKCPNTPAGERAITQGENIGCAESEIKIIVDETDTDGDGVYDKDDVCPKTPEGDDVEVIGKYKGCSDDQIDYLDDDDDGVINMDDKCPDTSYGLEVDVDGCPEKEIPKSTSIWPWMIGSIISLVLVGGGYFAYAKYPQMFGNLLGGSNKVQQSGRTMVSSAGINVPVKELPKKYVEQQLALKRRQQLKQKQKSIMQRSKELFSKFSRKTLSKDSKTSNITKVNNKTNNPNLKKDSKESKSFDELERLIREARSKRK